MGKLAFPDLEAGTPLYTLMRELHDLHARAGYPSLNEIVDRQVHEKYTRDRFGRDAVARLFSKTTREAPRLPLLWEVVRILAEMAPKADVDKAQERFDDLWSAADRYDGLQLPAQRAEDESDLECAPGTEAWGGRDE